MHDLSEAAPVADAEHPHPGVPSAPTAAPVDPVVSTHVLVPEGQARKLRDLSRITRVAQSEYLREAVENLLAKYGRTPDDNDG